MTAGCRPATSRLTIFDPSATTGWLYSYYLQNEWRPVPKLTVNFGARYDQMAEYVNGRQLSPRVNVVWQPTDSTTLTVGYSRYFVPPPFELIAPTTVGLFANTTAAPAVTQDDRAKPERDHYFDVSGTQIILPGLKAGIDAYYKIASNLLDEGQFGAPIILTPFNYHHGLVDGIEFTTSYDVGDWSFYGNLRRRGRSAKTSPRPNSILTPTSWPISPTIISISTTIRPLPDRPGSNTGSPRPRP